MIDIEKMKALAAFADRLRVEDTLCKHGGFTEEANLIFSILSELEAREADRRDAERYRWLRSQPNDTKAPRIDVVLWEEIDESANGGCGLRMDELDIAIDAALAQRQGEDHD